MVGVFLVLFWCAAVAGAVVQRNSRNSRLRGFNSRLGTKKFPFSRLRELPDKRLIGFAFAGAETALFEDNGENSRFDGNSREFSPASDGNCCIACRPRHPPDGDRLC
jgi:hypothetical protein